MEAGYVPQAENGLDGVLSGLRAAAEPTRLRILALCAKGELTVSELVEILGQSQPRVSRHLKVMVDAGLLERLREGSWVFHRLSRRGPGAELADSLCRLIPGGSAAIDLDAERLSTILQRRARRADAYFRHNAYRWGELRALHADERQIEALIMDRLPGEDARILDIGTGTGRMLEVVASRAGYALGVDRSTEMLAVARENLARASLPNCDLRHADMYQLPFAEGSFDMSIIHQVLHFAESPGRAIAEAARVLRPGGRLLVIDLAPHDLDQLREDHEHRRLGFSDEEMAGWFAEAGLKSRAPQHLPGSPLTVVLWTAERAAFARETPLREVS